MITCGVEACYYNDNGICNNDDVQISKTGICISMDETFIEVEDGNTVLQDRCSNYNDCYGSCFIDDTPCDCEGNIEKCKGR